jgi:hypothetical protein
VGDETRSAEAAEGVPVVEAREFLNQLSMALTNDEMRDLKNSQEDAASIALLSFC